MLMICFQKYEVKKLADVAHIERAIRDKVYPKGCTLIPVSASDYRLIQYSEDGGIINNRFAVVDANAGINRKYLHVSILQSAPQFFATYQSGINLQFDILMKFFTVCIHNRETQEEIVKGLNPIEESIEKVSKQIGHFKDVKKEFLDAMFV